MNPLNGTANPERMFGIIPVDELLRLTQIPVVITKVAFEFSDWVVRCCRENKLQRFRKESNVLKNMPEYFINAMLDKDDNPIPSLSEMEHIKKEKTISETIHRTFMQNIQTNLYLLHRTIKSECKKQFPDIFQYELLTHITAAIFLLDRAREYEKMAQERIDKAVGESRVTARNRFNKEARDTLVSMCGRYQLQRTDLINAALDAIIIKANQIDFTNEYNMNDVLS